jgi:hypothetical protein
MITIHNSSSRGRERDDEHRDRPAAHFITTIRTHSREIVTLRTEVAGVQHHAGVLQLVGARAHTDATRMMRGAEADALRVFEVDAVAVGRDVDPQDYGLIQLQHTSKRIGCDERSIT